MTSEESDPSTVSLAERALGFAATETGDLSSASVHLRRAAEIADRAGLAQRAAEARRSLTRVLVELGDSRGALLEADRAAGPLRGVDLARLIMMRSLVQERLGLIDSALAGYGQAMGIFRRSGDRLMEARTLCNRGFAQTVRGALTLAETDLVRAEELCIQLGQAALGAKVRHNLGIVAARRGDAPAALSRFDKAETDYRSFGLTLDHAILTRDRCAVLLSVGLTAEARASGEQAASELLTVGATAEHAEALLLLSECLLLDGDVEQAEWTAREVHHAFIRQRRMGWAAVARLAVARARFLAGERTPSALAYAQRAQAALDGSGLPLHAQDAALIAGQIALAIRKRRIAASQLSRAGRSRLRGPSSARAQGWHAEALLRLSHGDRRGAQSALRAGLRALERGRATLGASEFRVHAAARGDELAQLGLSLALGEGRPTEVFHWAERWRAGSLWMRPARPPEDGRLAADLAELRRVSAELQQAASTGEPIVALARQHSALERSIIWRSRTARGTGLVAETPVPTRLALARALGDRALVALVESNERLFALLVTGQCMRLRALCGSQEALAELSALQFALRRLALGRGSTSSLVAAAEGARHAASRLDELLLLPLPELGGRPLVVVPTGDLHALPWAVLPSLSGRPVTVAPSAALWLRAARRPRGPEVTVALVSGPDLPGGADEVRALARRYKRSRRLTGRRATAAATAAALDGADLAHVAAHGSYRSDNPLFSSLRLADGPLIVYELERLGRAPRVVVLSACDSGLNAVRPGDELMGLGAALLTLGTQAIVASVGLAPDWATKPLMLDFHRRLRAGQGPAVALAAAQAALRASDGDEHAAIAAQAAFVCLGAG